MTGTKAEMAAKIVAGVVITLLVIVIGGPMVIGFGAMVVETWQNIIINIRLK